RNFIKPNRLRFGNDADTFYKFLKSAFELTDKKLYSNAVLSLVLDTLNSPGLPNEQWFGELWKDGKKVYEFNDRKEIYLYRELDVIQKNPAAMAVLLKKSPVFKIKDGKVTNTFLVTDGSKESAEKTRDQWNQRMVIMAELKNSTDPKKAEEL